MTTTQTKLLTADDLLRLYSQGVRGELIRGVLCETMPTGQEHGEIAAVLAAELVIFTRTRKLGRVTTSDAGVRLGRDPDTVREPDVAYFSAEKMPPGVRVTGYSETAPDLVVEIASPSDSRSQIHDKARMWLSHGVRLVWVVQPDTRTIDVHRGDRDAGDPRRGRRPRRHGRPARLHVSGEGRLRGVAPPDTRAGDPGDSQRGAPWDTVAAWRDLGGPAGV